MSDDKRAMRRERDQRKDRRCHLSFLQGIISRLSYFGLAMQAMCLAMVLTSGFLMRGMEEEAIKMLASVVALIVLVFWGLDGYYLSQERLFRSQYERVRKQAATDYTMVAGPRPLKTGWLPSTLSVTLYVYYLMQLALLGGMTLALCSTAS